MSALCRVARVRWAAVFVLLAGLVLPATWFLFRGEQMHPAGLTTSTRSSSAEPRAYARPVFSAIADPRIEIETLQSHAAQDPLGFLEMALDRYDRSVRDYTCTFTKQECLNGRLSTEQVMKVMFRESPFSVRMEWIQNQDKCSRVLYVANQWVRDGQEFAVVEPGPIARLLVPYVMRPIHGPDARKSSRRTIDQFGLRNSLMLTIKYAKLAREQNQLRLDYKGLRKLEDGSEAYLFERHLPYVSEDGPWPDRVLEVYMDTRLLLPVLCVAYADDAKTRLLGRYRISDVTINPNLPDSIFTKEGMGLP